MPSLADVQRHMRDAVVTGEGKAMRPLLIGGQDPLGRLAIHQRHYEASLVSALMGRFSATSWLVGSPRVEAAARAFVRRHPPTAPCVAEYGEDFPTFLAGRPDVAQVPYLEAFASLDWYLGRIALATEEPAGTREQLAQVDGDRLAGATVRLQDGAYYVHAHWPLDELMTLYLTDSAPDCWTLVEGDVWFQVYGNRGSLRFTRLDAGTYAFRAALADGRSLAEAVGRGLDVDGTFQPGAAFGALVDEGLVTALGPSTGEIPA